MGQLRDQMARDLKLRGLRPSTCASYLRCARCLAAYHGRSPATMTEDDVKTFMLHLLEARKLARSTYLVYHAAIVFLYVHTLRRPDVVAGLPRPKYQRRPAPPVLTTTEVARLLACAPSPIARTVFIVAFGCGLRIGEVRMLRAQDIRSQDGLLVVREGKGGKSRVVMLSPKVLDELRAHWKRTRPPGPWLFPARVWPAPKHGSRWADHPASKQAIGQWFRAAAAAADLRDGVTFHTLRHSFATALLEMGVALNTIQITLGHADLATTTRYAQVRPELIRRTPSPIDAVLGG